MTAYRDYEINQILGPYVYIQQGGGQLYYEEITHPDGSITSGFYWEGDDYTELPVEFVTRYVLDSIELGVEFNVGQFSLLVVGVDRDVVVGVKRLSGDKRL